MGIGGISPIIHTKIGDITIMSDLNGAKVEQVSKIKEYSENAQAEIQSVLFECPKCDCKQTKVIGKQSYFSAIGKFFIGFITAFLAPLILAIKVIILIGTFKFYKLNKLFMHEMWNKYILWVKCWLIVLTFGLYNVTKVYTCENCGKKWIV